MTDVTPETTLSPAALMVQNRLVKNSKRLSRWIKQQQISAYRLYDADIPEYAAAVDVYQSGSYVHAVVQEYAAPKTIAADVAQQRLQDLVAAVGAFLAIPPASIAIKSRQRQRGKEQYQRAEDPIGREIRVKEGAAQYRLNLYDYLDTGVFLDHRPIRRYIYEHARDKRVLNLFCYTATASVQAALGGARETLSIDLSNTYLDWARRNFLLNKMAKNAHRLKRENCLEWLAYKSKRPHTKYDLIFLDPPSFSNSKSMDSVLDIQRDHVRLIRQSMRLLERGGTLIFSTNLRKFKLDRVQLNTFTIEDYCAQSLDPDFERNAKIHQCYLIRFTS